MHGLVHAADIMTVMRVFVFEHICGGGMLGQPLPPSQLAQGSAMLRAAACDFRDAGHEVVTMLEERAAVELTDVKIVAVARDAQVHEIFDRLTSAVDAVLVIAPEYERILETWSLRLGALGARSLGAPPEAVAMCADKLRLHRRLCSAKSPTPITSSYPMEIDPALPLVIKPRWGAGCEDTYVCHEAQELKQLPQRDDWIAQELISGVPASVSLIVSEQKTLPLLPGAQIIHSARSSATSLRQLQYAGGRIGLDETMSRRAIALGMQAVRAVPTLRGFVGVDLVLSEDPAMDRIIEINPRLTLSYVGLRALCMSSLATAMLDDSATVRWAGNEISFDAAGHVLREKSA